jgi:nitroreductase
MDAVLRRRSIRKYTGDRVSDEQVKRLLKAAMAAPSAGNQQPWQFVVVRDKATLATLARTSPYTAMTADAVLAILVCGDLSDERHPGFWVQDCSAAVENILIEVEELGLGAVWLGIYPIEERMDFLREALHIPDPIMPFALIAIGHPAETKPPADRYDESRIHNERW